MEILKKIGLLSLLFVHHLVMPVVEMNPIATPAVRDNFHYEEDYEYTNKNCLKDFCQPSEFDEDEKTCRSCCPPSKGTVLFGVLIGALCGGLYAGLHNDDYSKTCITFESSDELQAEIYMKSLGGHKEKLFSLDPDEKKCVKGFDWSEITASFNSSNYPADKDQIQKSVGNCNKRSLIFDGSPKAWKLLKCNKDKSDRRLSPSGLTLKDVMDLEDIVKYRKKTVQYLRGSVNFK